VIAAFGRGSAAKPHAPKAASPGGGHQRGGATRGEETGVSAEGATCAEVAARERWVRAGGYTSRKNRHRTPWAEAGRGRGARVKVGVGAPLRKPRPGRKGPLLVVALHVPGLVAPSTSLG